jgi:hypothetical protein
MDRRFNSAAYEEAFEWDGSLRDVYVLSTSLNDWHEFLTFVKSSRHPHSLRINGALAALPEGRYAPMLAHCCRSMWEA